MTTAPFARSITIDYSDDELDALATAFNRADLARRPDRAGDDPVRRAQRQTALRGLVARHAIALSGSSIRPQIRFLEPHATMLGAYLGAPVLATVRHESAGHVRAITLFAHDEVVVHQEALAGQALQRMSAHGVASAAGLLEAELRFPDVIQPTSAVPIELTRRMITGATEAFDRLEPAPDCVPKFGADLLYARVSSGSVTFTARDRGGVVSAEKWAWLDAGSLGLWRVHTDETSPMVRFVPAASAPLAAEITAAWATALQAAPGLAAATIPQET